MEGTWRSLFIFLLTKSCTSTESDIKENIPLQTLNCHNDFTSRIICQWEEVADAQRYLNLTLYRQEYSSYPPNPVSCEPGENITFPTCQFQSCIPRSCLIRQTIFVSSQKDIFSFRTDPPLQVQLNLNLTQNVLPPAPENLKIMKNGTKAFLLSWEMPQSWNQSLQEFLGGLKFKVAYKRRWESWEEASTMDSSEAHVLLEYDHLIPNDPYVARVRAISSAGYSSPWSHEFSWNSQEGNAAQPKNLQCFFDGHKQLSCTWEVRAEITSSVTFGLLYKAGSHEAKECIPVYKERILGSPYIRYRCQTEVQDPINQSQYTVTVQSKAEKHLRSHSHIQPSKPVIMVKKMENSYYLQWKKPLPELVQKYQVQYRTSTQTWEEAHNETLKIILEMSISKTSLKPDTQYFARVRARVEQSHYSGTWSEWSEECSWKTERVFPSWILGLLLIIITLLMLLGAWFCYTLGVRLKKDWENRIPNPSKSNLFQKKNQKIKLPGNLFTFSQESPWERERKCSVCRVDWMDSEENGSSVSHLTTVDPQDACSLSSDPEPHEALGLLPDGDLSLSSSCKVPQPNTLTKDPASGFDFNGPYLRLPQSHSLPNVSGQMGPCQADGSKKQPCGSLEYFCLPQSGQGGLVPVAKSAKPGSDTKEKETLSGLPSNREAELCPLREQDGPPPGELRQENNLSQLAASSKAPLKLAGGSGYIAPEDLVLGSEKAESLPSPSTPPLPCSAPESSLDLGSLPVPSPERLALEGYVEAPASMISAEAPPEHLSPSPVGTSAPNLTDAQQKETITVLHPDGPIVLQQIGDYCFFPSQGQPVSPGNSPEKMAKPQDVKGKEPPGQPLPPMPAIQFFKAMKHQDYLVLPTWDGNRPGQVC
ncbi:cytokine receptor common subunit beta isoform X1 [Sarcophilus harrisii]|uniref:Colony stimulating factor 2 receptor subunit beta n=1 Tax=Sarcophilus harrisii TaxID=9305 RepID=G3WKI5_SARHA|nr:cytokine receptor common subunit beta isoform X1 [Sarcophilus harrisii]